ncbi:amino acid adenylation domain-containing protein [Streptacidiphilus sp. PB12-B1b]|uniref:Pls/PosA family non-ribosomal peptide synthetase n=1 Tax=Streptacidiphilus sp. PB12-B1b TaxID=2705012 RepID=UPI0015FC7CF1|nr:Pls/PosA family non-ribosomal peptide synthetase [Streptacidiphilus sp. PB12-B1b]QMU80628.1 amino acid adenylation domain-containing protein [Streptacidiphilus sp. PB12-B1b]
MWPSRAPAPARTLVDVLDDTVRRYPLAPALDAGDGAALDYRGLRAAAGALAAELARRGVGPGDRVGVRRPSGTAGLYTAVLGVLCAGAAYVPVDVDDPDERAELIWADAGVCAVLGEGGTFTPGPAPAGGGSRPPGPDDDAWIIFTSGTTGRPKGVAVTHRSAAAFVDAEAGLFLRDAPLGPGDRVLAGLSVAFDASCEEMWLAWRSGGCLVPAPRSLVRAGADLGPWLAERGITAVSTVPTLAALWPAAALDRIRLLIVGGEACPAELVERLDAPGREFWNTYGPTETTVVACGSRMRAGQPVRIGEPLDGWELAVVGPGGEPVAWGEVGELLIGGVGAARYLDPAKDAERFRPHPALPGPRCYRSGDLVRADPEGLVYVGRADEQVKLGGRRIELGEIDAALAALPGVRAASAAVRTTPAGGQVLVGYLVPEPGAAAPSAQALRERLAQRLPPALLPVLAFLPELPIRTSGKVDRAALPWPLPGADAPAAGELSGTAGWLAERWRELLGVPAGADSDFFALGGTSLAAARLVSLLRERHPGASVADVYHRPRLADLAAHLDRGRAAEAAGAGADGLDAGADAAPGPVRSVPLRAGAVQAAVLTALQAVTAVRLLLPLAALDNLVGPLPWTVHTPWWLLGVGWLLLSSAFGRASVGAGGARLLTLGLRPGSHPRGGAAHLRLWTAERLVAAFSVAAVVGTPLARRYARMLGCRVGPDVHLHTLPPVTGLAEFGAGCSLEPEVDAAGWWLDGDRLHLGAVRVGPGARIGTRAVLMPGADVGAGAEIAPGSCVTGRVPSGQHWHGVPARPQPPVPGNGADGASAAARWPNPRHRRSRAWELAYGLSLPLLQGLPLLSALPALLLLYRLVAHQRTLGGAGLRLLAASGPLSLLSLALYALLTAALVRLLSRPLTPGLHPALGRAAWCSWAVLNLTGTARSVLFPLYASLLTPGWLRLLGADVGRRVEASTVLGLPGLMRVDDYAFLADDTLLAPFEVRGGWLRLGSARVGRRSFVGNSGIVGPDRALPDDSLVGVLSDVPPPGHLDAGPGGSWLGRPGFPVRRVPERADAARTYDPPRRLVWARAAVELCRVVPVLLSVLLGDAAVCGLQALLAASPGPLPLVLGGGLLLLGCGLTACLLTTAAKWLLLGRYRAGQRPLWSSFVWRNELFDSWVEELAMPWLGSALVGTPFLNLWLRSLGAGIGRGVWCETHWLPELDLVRVGAGASLNRGVVLQTHLFHDRLLRMDAVTVGAGATVGPHSIVLLGAELGERAVVGPSSLVMRGERLPGGGRWLGNPVADWPQDRARR